MSAATARLRNVQVVLERYETAVSVLEEMPSMCTCAGWTTRESAALRLALKLVSGLRDEFRESGAEIARGAP